MIRVTDHSHVPASPERVWAFFADLEAHYLDWHPEHIEFRAIKGTPVAVGSVYFFDEWIGRFRLRTRARVAEVREQRFLRHEGMFPHSLLRAGGSFAFEPAGDGGCYLVAEMHVGWDIPVLGSLLARLLGRGSPVEAGHASSVHRPPRGRRIEPVNASDGRWATRLLGWLSRIVGVDLTSKGRHRA